MEEINEGSSCKIAMAFYDEDDLVLIPDSISYILYDKFSSTQRTSGTITPASSVELEISATYNDILDQSNRYEVAVFQVTFISGTKTCNDTYQYKILNLAKIT